jgi:hypothetical protein
MQHLKTLPSWGGKLNTCTGCREQQTVDHLCLSCIEDLSSYLREIPDLYAELDSVRLPGSVSMAGPWTSRPNRLSSPAPVRLGVVDLLDRGETLSRLLKWTDVNGTVSVICAGFRSHLLTIVTEPWIGDFYRDMRALCRDLGRTVGQPEELPVGKCSKPGDGDELCRGQLMRLDGGGVYCRRCGDKPELSSRQVWLTDRETAMAVGRPLETVRTWIKRGRAGFPSPTWDAGRWSVPIGPRMSRHAWLPTAVSLATEPQRSAIVNHGSRAELSAEAVAGIDARRTPLDVSASSASAGAGQAVAPIRSSDQTARGGAAGEGKTVPVVHQATGATQSGTGDVDGAEEHASRREQLAKSTDQARP